LCDFVAEVARRLPYTVLHRSGAARRDWKSVKSLAEGETHMVKNVGGIDRVIRIVVGLGLLSLVFVGPQTPWGWIGIVPLATALLGFCPINSIFKINTAKD
jgi:hypothetical protein